MGTKERAHTPVAVNSSGHIMALFIVVDPARTMVALEITGSQIANREILFSPHNLPELYAQLEPTLHGDMLVDIDVKFME